MPKIKERQHIKQLYEQADEFLQSDQAEEAVAVYTELMSIESEKDTAQKTIYENASNQLENKKYEMAETLFMSLNGYSDSNDMAKECVYRESIDIADSNYKDAFTNIEAIIGYKDSEDLYYYWRIRYNYDNGNVAQIYRMYKENQNNPYLKGESLELFDEFESLIGTWIGSDSYYRGTVTLEINDEGFLIYSFSNGYVGWSDVHCALNYDMNKNYWTSFQATFRYENGNIRLVDEGIVLYKQQ